MKRNQRRIYIIAYTALLAFMLVALFACDNGSDRSSNGGDAGEQTPIQAATPDDEQQTEPPMPEEPPEPEPYTNEAVMMAVGDIMMHLPQTESGYDAATDSYNFDFFFTEVAPLLSQGDWVFGNLETPLGGADLRYSGYPEFNAPPELADALKLAGFNILSTSNNHSYDRREKGLLRTLEAVRARDIIAIGTAASVEEAETIHVVTHNDIAIAFLAYTYGTNGIIVPADKPYLVSMLDEERIIDDIRRAKQLEPDLVALSLHFGNEYQSKPTADQQRMVKRFIEEGADIILGHHPHVLQPYETIEVTTEDGQTKQGVVIYSMGNFISNQDRFRNNNHPTEIGAMFKLVIRKHFPEQTVEIASVEAIPTYVHKHHVDGRLKYRIMPLADTLEAQQHELLADKDYNILQGYYEQAVSTLESFAAKAVAEQ